MFMKLNMSLLCHVGKEETGQYVNNLSAVAGFKTHFPATLNLIFEPESPKYLDYLKAIKGTITKKIIQDDDLNMMKRASNIS